jgi:hypothetical protein
MTRDIGALVPTTLPVWLKLVSIFSLWKMTLFIESSLVLTIAFILAPLRLVLADTSPPHGFDASLATVGTLSEGFARLVALPHYLLGYC